MQIKNLNQLFFILIIGLFALQTSTLFCTNFIQSTGDKDVYDQQDNPNNYYRASTDKFYNYNHEEIPAPENPIFIPPLSGGSSSDQYDNLRLDLPLQQHSSSSSFLQSPPSPTRVSSPTRQQQRPPSSLTSENLSFLPPQFQPQSGGRPPSFHSLDENLGEAPAYSIPSSPTASETSFAAPEELSFDDQQTYPQSPYPSVQALSNQRPQFSPSSSSSSSAPLQAGEDFYVSPFPAAPATGLTAAEQAEITKFLDSSLVLVAQLGSGKLNPTDDDKVAVRSSQSIFDPNKNALPFQFYEAGAPNLLGLSFGDLKDANPEKAGIFGRAKSGTLEDSVMHKAFRTRCQTHSTQFHTLCTQKFDQLKMARDADKNGSTADDGIAFWSASHKFLTLPSYLVYWAEILEITQEINRLCQREGVSSSSSSSLSDQGTKITIARGTPDDAKTNTPTTTVSELATQIAEILFGRGSELSGDLKTLEKNATGDGLDTILLVNNAYLPETKTNQQLSGMRWTVHDDFQFNDEKPEQVKKGNAQFLRADAEMRDYFAAIANELQTLLEYLTTNAQVDTNLLTEHENAITSLLDKMIPLFFSNQGFGLDLAKPILALAQVSESWRLVISTLIENNSHQEDKSKKALEEYVNFVGKKEKYGIKGPEYKISKDLETFCEERSEFFLKTDASHPVARIEQITVANGLSEKTPRTSLFALRDQDFRLPIDATHRGALCLNCGHSPFSLALVIAYLSNTTNRLYKVFFEDDRAFGEMDRIAAQLWGDAESLTRVPHRRDTLDFVHNPMSFRCSWCRHLERVWSKSENLETWNGQSWTSTSRRLSALFNHVYIQGSNKQDFRLQIADFPIVLNPDCLIFPAHNDSEQKSFQTIGVDLDKIIPLFRRGPAEENVVDLKTSFPGISDQEILNLKVRIARTLQDLFGAWMAMTPEEGQEFARLTPSERWTGAGAAIAFPPNPTFQGGNRPGTLTLPSGEPERFEGKELSGTPDETGGFSSPSPSSLTKTSPKKPRRQASTLPNLPSSSFTGPIRPGSGSHIATSMISSPSGTHTFDPSFVQPPALDEPGRLDSDEPTENPDELNAGPNARPEGQDSRENLRRRRPIPSDGRIGIDPSPYSLPPASLDEEEDNPDSNQPPVSPGKKKYTPKRRRVQPEDEPIEEMGGSYASAIITQKGRIETPRFTLHLSSKLTTTPEFDEAIQRATSLLEGINLYTSQLTSKQDENPELQSILKDLNLLSRTLEQAIRTAQQTAEDGNPKQATNDLTTDTNQAQAKFDEIAERTSIIQEEGRAAADLASMHEKLAAMAPVSKILTTAQALTSGIRQKATDLTTDAGRANSEGKKYEAAARSTTAEQLLLIIDNPLIPLMKDAASVLQNPESPLSDELVTRLKDDLVGAQQSYQALLTDLKKNLEKAQQLDQKEAKREEEKARRRTFVQDDTSRDQGNSRTGAFTGPERQPLLVGVASSHQLNPSEEPFENDFPGSEGEGDFNKKTTRSLNPKRSRTPTPPRSPKTQSASPRRTPLSASLTLSETNPFEEGDDLPDTKNVFPQFTREQSLVEEEGGLPPEQDQFFNSNYSFSTDGGEDDDHLASDEDPEMAQILENVAAAENPPPSPIHQPRRDAFTTSASPSDRPTLFPTARFIGLDQRKTSNPANQNVHELDQFSPAFPRGFNKRDGQGFGHLEDNDPLGTSISSSASWLQGSTQKSFPSAQVTAPFSKLQTIYNKYNALNQQVTPYPADTNTFLSIYQTKMYPLLGEIKKYKDPAQKESYINVMGATHFGRETLFATINSWVYSAYVNLQARHDLTPNQRSLLLDPS